MKYMIKVGTQYVTADGSLSSSQHDALKIAAGYDGALPSHVSELRIVKLRPRNHDRVVDDPAGE